MPPTGVEPAIPASERPQTDTFDRAGTGTGDNGILQDKIHIWTTAHCSVFYSLKFCSFTFHECINFRVHRVHTFSLSCLQFPVRRIQN